MTKRCTYVHCRVVNKATNTRCYNCDKAEFEPVVKSGFTFFGLFKPKILKNEQTSHRHY